MPVRARRRSAELTTRAPGEPKTHLLTSLSVLSSEELLNDPMQVRPRTLLVFSACPSSHSQPQGRSTGRHQPLAGDLSDLFLGVSHAI